MCLEVEIFVRVNFTVFIFFLTFLLQKLNDKSQSDYSTEQSKAIFFITNAYFLVVGLTDQKDLVDRSILQTSG